MVLHHWRAHRRCSPFLENLRKKGLEVLYMVNSVDEYAVQQLKEFDGKKLKSTTKEGLYLGDGGGKKEHEELKELFEPLTKLMTEVLGDNVEKVIVSRRIVDSLCVLTTSRVRLVCQDGAHHESTGIAL